MRVDSLAYGGAGVARLNGRVLFVPRTAPGDLVQIVAHEGELTAGLLRVLEAGEQRVAPLCIHAAECDGCHWQHVALPAQTEAKRQALIESLARLGGIARDRLLATQLFSSPLPFRYRRRARFVVRRDGSLGYSTAGGRPGVALRECQLLSPALERVALAISAVLRRLAPRPSHVSICAANQASAAFLEFSRPMASASLRAFGERLLAEVGGLEGVVVRAGDRVAEVGQVELEDELGLLRPDAFAQANREINAILTREVMTRLAPAPEDRVLELFAGSGNFTLALASHVRAVVAIEREGVALALCRRALARREVDNVQLLPGDAAQLVGVLDREGERFDLALLDPPRSGAREVLEGLAALAPRRIAYVSCDPATLARDVKILGTKGYRLASAAVFDQFPQTYHLEALAILDRA